MKMVQCKLVSQRSMIVWANDDAVVGDKITTASGEAVITFLMDVDGSSPKVYLKPTEIKIDDYEIPAMGLEVDDEMWYNLAYVRITRLNKTQGNYYIYADAVSLETGAKMPSIKIPKESVVKIKPREAIAMLHVQNTHEQSAKVTAKLEQLLNILSTEPKSDGKIGLGTSISIDKETLVNVARSELKAEGSKLAEMLKKV